MKSATDAMTMIDALAAIRSPMNSKSRMSTVRPVFTAQSKPKVKTEIEVWNDAVDARKAEKRERKTKAGEVQG